MGNNFYLLVDVLICLEPFGVVRFENTNFKTVNFKNFTPLTWSIFFPSLSVEELLMLCGWDFS